MKNVNLYGYVYQFGSKVTVMAAESSYSPPFNLGHTSSAVPEPVHTSGKAPNGLTPRV